MVFDSKYEGTIEEICEYDSSSSFRQFSAEIDMGKECVLFYLTLFEQDLPDELILYLGLQSSVPVPLITQCTI